MLDYELTDRAIQDLRHAREWYDKSNPELYDQLLAEVQSAILVAREHPMRFPKYGIYSRALRCTKFPYRVIYEVHPALILVKAIYHTARNPDRWDDSTRD